MKPGKQPNRKVLQMTDPTLFEANLSEVRQDVREMRGSMSKIADAMTRMAVLEERHINTVERVGKIEDRVRDVEKKSSENEKAHLKLMATIGGVTGTTKILWLVIGATVAGLSVRGLSVYFGV